MERVPSTVLSRTHARAIICEVHISLATSHAIFGCPLLGLKVVPRAGFRFRKGQRRAQLRELYRPPSVGCSHCICIPEQNQV